MSPRPQPEHVPQPVDDLHLGLSLGAFVVATP